MNKMMKLLLVAEGCTLATMACEPGHWYVGGGVGMVYRTAKPQVKKVEISEGDKLYGVIVTERNQYNPLAVSNERDAINEAITAAINKGWNMTFTLNAGYERSFGRLNLGAELGMGIQSGKCSLKSTNELLFRRLDETINPAGTYGWVKVPLSIPLVVFIGGNITDSVGLRVKAGIKLINTRTKVRQSLDNAAGINPDNQEPGDVDKLTKAYHTKLTKGKILATPTYGAEIKFAASDKNAIHVEYTYSRYRAPIHKDALIMHGQPKIKVSEHGIRLKYTRTL